MALTLVPARLEIEAGRRTQIQALKTAGGFFGGSQYVNPALIAWQISDPKVIGIDPDTGELRTIGPGRASVTARFMDDVAVANVTVTPSGLSLKTKRGQALVAGQSRTARPEVVSPEIGQQAGAALASVALGAAFVATGRYLEKELVPQPSRRRR